MKNTLETRLGLFFALALIAAFIILEMVGGLDFFKKGYRLHALFDNVQELKVGDPVKMAGVAIGRVDRIELTNNQVRVTMKLGEDAQVRTDSKARIQFTGLMGQNFVSVDFGSPQGVRAAEGTYLQTLDQPDLGSLMLKIDNAATGIENLTKNFSGDNIQNLLGPFTDFLNQNGPRLTAIFGNLEVISSRIAEGKGTVGRLINEDTLYVSALGAMTNLQTAADDIKGVTTDAKSLLANANIVIDQVNSGRGTVGRLVKDETLYNETTAAMMNLREVLEKVNKGQGSIGKLINDESLLKNAKLSLQKLDKATEGLEDQGPLSILGIAVNSLF